MQVATDRALDHRRRDHRVLSHGVHVLGHRDHHARHLVHRALVVDKGSRPELANCNEARPVQVVVMLTLPARDVRRQWEAREVVAREKPFRGEVPVGVEVRLEVGRFLIEQQVQLGFSLSSQALGPILVHCGLAVIHDDRVLRALLPLGSAVQIAPASAGRFEAGRDLVEVFGDPALVPPVGGFDTGHSREHLRRPLGGGSARARRLEVSEAIRIHRQGCVASRNIEHTVQRPSHLDVRNRQPDGVKMGPNEILVQQFESRRLHLPRNHESRVTEEILVVHRTRRAVGDDECRLT